VPSTYATASTPAPSASPACAGQHLELGYASTVHRAQGMTVDAAHVLVDRTMTREAFYVAMSRGRTSNRAYVVTDESIDVDLHHPPGPTLEAGGVLRGVLGREGSEHSATETLTETLESAESLATLVPRYLDACARALLTGALQDSVRAGLRDAGGRALEERVAAAPDWQRLLLACAGQDPRERVAEAVRSRLLDGPEEVRDPATVLAWRVANLTTDGAPETAVERFRPPWLLPPPPGLATDPIAGWAAQQDTLVTDRVRALVERVASQPPRWADRIPARPQAGPERDRWERDMAVVVAYRDQLRVPDDVLPWAATAPPGRGGEVETLALAAWRRLRDPGPGTVAQASVDDRLRALLTRPAPRAPDDELSRQRTREQQLRRPARLERGPRL